MALALERVASRDPFILSSNHLLRCVGIITSHPSLDDLDIV